MAILVCRGCKKSYGTTQPFNTATIVQGLCSGCATNMQEDRQSGKTVTFQKFEPRPRGGSSRRERLKIS